MPAPIGGGHRFFDEVDFAGLGAVGAVLDGALFDLRDFRRHADDDARADPDVAVVRLLDEVGQHLLGDVEVGDDAVLHRLDGDDVAGRAAQHVLGVFADGFDAAVDLVDGHDRGLVDHDALAACVDAGVGRAEVDGEVAREDENTERRLNALLLALAFGRPAVAGARAGGAQAVLSVFLDPVHGGIGRLQQLGGGRVVGRPGGEPDRDRQPHVQCRRRRETGAPATRSRMPLGHRPGAAGSAGLRQDQRRTRRRRSARPCRSRAAQPRRMPAISTSVRLPARWPCESLTALKPSTSMKSSDSGCRGCGQRASLPAPGPDARTGRCRAASNRPVTDSASACAIRRALSSATEPGSSTRPSSRRASGPSIGSVADRMPASSPTTAPITARRATSGSASAATGGADTRCPWRFPRHQLFAEADHAARHRGKHRFPLAHRPVSPSRRSRALAAAPSSRPPAPSRRPAGSQVLQLARPARLATRCGSRRLVRGPHDVGQHARDAGSPNGAFAGVVADG